MARIKGSTQDAHTGRPHGEACTINPPVEMGSTILFPDYATFRDQTQPLHYGRGGASTHRAFEENLAALEGADAVTLTSSGVEAISLAVMSLTSKGGHILCTDTAYDPTRLFLNWLKEQAGIDTTYYDPRIGGNIASLIQPNTQLVFCESPGSLTFEVQDIPAIVAAAADIPVAVDNTYGAGAYLRPIELGASVSIQSITKYVGGHSDLLMGAVMSANETIGKRIHKTARIFGQSVSGHDVALAHRGLRTLHRRLSVHQENGLALAAYLADRPEIAEVLHPGLPSHPDHALWLRDGKGTNGLFSVITNWEDDRQTEAFMNALSLYGLGYSWGGYESLCIPAWPARVRTAVPWTEKRQLLRFHAGLEEIDDLTADLDQAFDKLPK
ncbi:MAG: cystathionine beta-lyase [Pseudomonadota bacterium]